MMKYNELKANLSSTTYTTLQANLEVNKYIGKEIEINTMLYDIVDDKIIICKTPNYYDDDSWTNIQFDKNKFEKDLQTLKKASNVKIIVKLTTVDYDITYPDLSRFYFDLIAIENCKT